MLVLELARVLAKYTPRRTIRFLWCNEEHCPWTSITAAANAKKRGDNLIAVINVDSIGGKSQAEIDQGKKPNVTLYTTEEGKRLLASIATRAKPILIFTGGEPMAREDIYELARTATDLGLRAVMSPCGPLVTPDTVRQLRESGIKRISISLDGATAADFLRTVKQLSEEPALAL